ncbi:MAG: hypothetical protein O4808_01820 [Trichodesmium sp. St17_bin3_1_1]|nr:hypothetical protein [Trichodesmium sp. St17_bin3_1_1]
MSPLWQYFRKISFEHYFEESLNVAIANAAQKCDKQKMPGM